MRSVPFANILFDHVRQVTGLLLYYFFTSCGENAIFKNVKVQMALKLRFLHNIILFDH